ASAVAPAQWALDQLDSPVDYEAMASDRLVCPSCGSARTAPLAMGIPGPELEERAARGEVVLGGDVLDGGLLTEGGLVNHGCLDCGHRWRAAVSPWGRATRDPWRRDPRDAAAADRDASPSTRPAVDGTTLAPANETGDSRKRPPRVLRL